MKLYLIRHAESYNNINPRALRTADPPLTARGVEEARFLAEAAADLSLTDLYVSPFLRTLQTVAPIAEATRLVPEISITLHEVGGCYSGYSEENEMGRPGMTRAEISRKFPTFANTVSVGEDGWWKSPFRETETYALERARELIQRTHVEFSHTDRHVAYITHADLIMLIMQELGIPVEHVPANASITCFDVLSGRYHLRYFNRNTCAGLVNNRKASNPKIACK